MTNREILNYGEGERTRFLTEIQRQTLYCLAIAMVPTSCPACHTMVNQVEASGVDIDEFDATGVKKHEFHCPHCKRQITEIVPFMTSGPAKYQWQLTKPLPPESEK